jgi:hypothetical protein
MKPWEKEGVSRATFFRHRRRDVSQQSQASIDAAETPTAEHSVTEIPVLPAPKSYGSYGCIRTRVAKLEATIGSGDDVTLEQAVPASYGEPDPDFERRLANSSLGRLIAAACPTEAAKLAAPKGDEP